MNPQEYCDHHLNQAHQYIDDVLNDRILVGKYEKKAVQLFLKKKEKYLFQEESVRQVIRFFALLNINHRNKVNQFKLLPYQTFTLLNLYGLYTDPETRLIDGAIISMSKKQGKTSFLSALSLYECVLDGERDANVLFVSTSTQQANLVLNYTKSIIENSPLISSFFTVHRNTIINKQKGSTNKIEIRSSDKDLVQGLNTSFSLVDEIFYHPDLTLKDRIRSGQAARTCPLQVCIGTVNTKESVTFELFETCTNILSGVIEQDNIFPYIFQQDSKEEIKDPATWRKSSPAINYTVTTDFLQKEYKASTTSETKKQVFLTDHLNFWSESNDQQHFVDDDTVKGILRDDHQIPTDSSIYLGCDFSSLNDLSAVAGLHYDKKTDTFSGKIYHIFPNNERNKIKKGSIDLSKWWLPNGQFENNHDEHGYIIRCDSKSLDETLVINLIDHISKKWKIKGFGFDPFNARILATRVTDELSIYTREVRQNYTMSFPLKMIEKYISEGRFFLDRSPVTRWQFQNVRVKTDRNNNYLITKNKGESVDGIVALTVAMTIFLEDNYNMFSNKLERFNF